MNFKKYLTCVAFATSFSFTGQTLAESSVWKVSKGKEYFYVGGTIHLLNAEDHPLPQEYTSAYKDSSEIIFETDIAGANSPEFQGKLMAAMMYNDDRTLKSELKPEVYSELEKFLAPRQIPIVNFSKFQPWGVALMLTIVEYQRLGMMPNYGIDIHFSNLATSDNKKVAGLETLDEQLGFLLSLAKVEPNESITYTLRDLVHLPDFIQLMKTSWRSGDLEALSNDPFVVEMKEKFPEVYNAIVTNRNNAWIKKLVELTKDADKEFVLVGAMHLNGKEGLLNLLKEEGFKVEKI